MMRGKKSPPLRYRILEVSFGWCAVARSEQGVCAFVLPVSNADAAEAAIVRRCEHATKSHSILPKLVAQVREYFHGWRQGFSDVRLDVSGGTAFQQRVWALARRIPCGEVRTYRWVGLEIGRPKAMRAIGAALGANPVPLIVPCHRVVAADGSLGGFSAEGGVDMKARLLELEGVAILGQGAKRKVGVRRSER